MYVCTITLCRTQIHTCSKEIRVGTCQRHKMLEGIKIGRKCSVQCVSRPGSSSRGSKYIEFRLIKIKAPKLHVCGYVLREGNTPIGSRSPLVSWRE